MVEGELVVVFGFFVVVALVVTVEIVEILVVVVGFWVIVVVLVVQSQPLGQLCKH